MAFHIPYYIFQWFIVTAYYHVYMAWHYTPGTYFKPLLAQAPLQTGKRLHWRKGVGRAMCVGSPCASLTHQSKLL